MSLSPLRRPVDRPRWLSPGHRSRLALLLLALPALGCHGKDADTGNPRPDADSDTDTDADTDADSDTDTDSTITALGQLVAVLTDTDGLAISGATVAAADAEGTTDADGAVTLDVPYDTPLIVSAMMETGVEVYQAALVPEGETGAVTLVEPVFESATFTPGADQELTVDGYTVTIGADVGFTAPDGSAWTGDVELRLARVDGTASMPPSASVDADGNALLPNVVSTFEATLVGSDGVDELTLEPTGPITLSTELTLDDTIPFTLESYDPTNGTWLTDGTVSYTAGVVTLEVTHFTYWRITNGDPAPAGGLLLAFTDTAASTHDYDVRCVADGDGAVTEVAWSAAGPETRCVQAASPSTCSVSVDGATREGVALDNTCVCNWTNDACDAYAWDLTEAAVCGDGTVQLGEECDDGNLESGDGCDASCLLEGCQVDWSGTVDGAPSVMSTRATCTFYVDEIGDASLFAIHDVDFDVTAVDIAKTAWWDYYTGEGGTVLVGMEFVTPFIIGDGSPAVTGDLPLAQTDIGFLTFDPLAAVTSFSSVDLPGQSFVFELRLGTLKYANGSYPPAAESGRPSDVDLPEATGSGVLTVSGRYETQLL